MLLTTERFILRSADSSDAGNLLCLFSDENVLRYLPQVKSPVTLDRFKGAVEKRRELESTLRYAPLIIELRENGEFLGNAGLQRIEETSEVEIAYHLLPSFGGRGYATEAAVVLLRFGFDTVHLKKIIGVCFQDNLASARVLEKAGMRYVDLASYFGIDGVKSMRNLDGIIFPGGKN